MSGGWFDLANLPLGPPHKRGSASEPGNEGKILRRDFSR
jgi:hypothetical protein